MSMAKAGKRPLRSLTAHEKLLAVKRVSAGGESKASVARDIGVPESTLRGWCKNQAKIFNQARASPNHLEEGEAGSPAKRTKLDEPYNLSMKDTSDSSYSPSSQFDGGEFPKATTEAEPETSPINLRAVTTPVAATKTTPVSSSSADKEREKNRAELARLSAELGLNRPEVFLSGFGGSSSVNDTLLFWNSIYNQLTYQQKLLQQHQQTKFPSSVDTGSKHPTSNGTDKRDKILPNTEQQPSVHDSVSYWLRQQTLMGLSTAPTTTTTSTCSQQQATSQPLPITTTVITTTSSMPEISTASSTFINSMSTNSAVSQMRLWNWYKQSLPTVNQLQALTTPQTNSDKQILYQQLIKPESDKEKDKQDTENEAVKEEKPRNNKNRSVLDNIFINNSLDAADTGVGTLSDKDESDTSLDIYQAVRHGEKFLKWLESCSDPSVTAVQIVTLQSLIKNLKKGFDRRNGDYQSSKTKVRRK